MNKSRRMAARQSLAFAQASYAAPQIDLLGCGDSIGDFGDATWADWVADIVQTANWLPQRHAAQVFWHWAPRAGFLVTAEAATQIDTPWNLLLWQPAPAGMVPRAQFLGLKAAGEMLDAEANGATGTLRARLPARESVEVAGYWLTLALTSELERASLAPPRVASAASTPGRSGWNCPTAMAGHLRLIPPLLACALAAKGFAVLRVDYRGAGESNGAQRNFEALSADIGSTIDVPQQRVPMARRVVLWRLYDGALAALLCMHDTGDCQVVGLCMRNP